MQREPAAQRTHRVTGFPWLPERAGGIDSLDRDEFGLANIHRRPADLSTWLPVDDVYRTHYTRGPEKKNVKY